MDSFTENILERARERQKKLTGSKESTKASPLKDTNLNVKTSTSHPNLSEAKKIARKEVVSDSSIACKSVNFEGVLKENKSEGNLPSPFKRNSSTRISSHLSGSPNRPVKTLNIQKDDFNMEIKLSAVENVRVEVEIKEGSGSDDDEHEENNKRAGSSESIDTNADDADKAGMREQVKHKLQKLGRLYAGGEDADISSPITRTEGKFLAEDLDDEAENKKENVSKLHNRTRKGLDKLADLAQNINNWEDDLSTPKRDFSKAVASPKKSWKPPAPQPPVITSSVKKSPGKFGKGPAPKPPAHKYSKNLSEAEAENNINDCDETPKALKWDNKMIKNLESQGFTRTTSNTKLVYSYNNGSQEINKKPSDLAATNEESEEEFESKPTVKADSNIKKVKESKNEELKQFKKGNPVIPSSPVKQRSAAIANKAALFEAPNCSSPTKNTKDPALLSVSERKALFEKNKGAALIPKAAFGMAVPQAKNESKGVNVETKQDKNISQAQLKDDSKNTNFKTQLKMEASKSKAKVEVSKSPQKAPKPSVIKQTKTSESAKVDSPRKSAIIESGGIASKMAALLTKKITISQEQIENSRKEQMQKEMDVLLNRFNRHKETFVDNDQDTIEEVEESDDEDASDTTAMLSKKSAQIVTKAEINASVEPKTPGDKRKSGEKRSAKKADSPQVQAVLEEVKRIKVTQPKEGKLYPCLSDIEANTETEPEAEPEPYTNTSFEESITESDEGNTSFGREILQAVCRNQSAKKRSLTNNESESEVSDILDDMDEFLEGYTDTDTTPGPTPPKQGKMSSPIKAVNMPQPSQSFHYKRFTPEKQDRRRSPAKTDFRSPAKVVTPRKTDEFPTHVVEGENVLPLTHTVSFYRKQTQTQISKTPVKKVSRSQPVIEEDCESIRDDSEAVQNKIKKLQEEVNKQLTVISQATQALNLCNSTLEFSGSTEQVEAEKLLLLATHRRQAALHEIQRLEVEGTLRPQGNSYLNSQAESGTLTITNISLPLKREYVRALAAAGGKGHHVICLIKCAEQVMATQLVSTVASSTKNPDLELKIPGYVRIEKVYSDSAITFEVYCLQAQQELLPHDLKYHINKKASSKLTPKKGKQDTRMIRPPKESPAGPHAVRSPSFALMGYVVFSIQAKNRTQWTLNKTPSMSPLEGSVEMRVSCELDISVEHRGFLTMFEDVSGFGAWHRRWCLLKGYTLSYWKYPDDERKKAPIDSIDLKNCITKQIGPVSREICARLHTFLIDRERPAQANDRESLTMVCKGDKTVIKHLLSADTKEERVEWCNMLNKALVGLRVWNNEF